MKINYISPDTNNYTRIITNVAVVPKRLYYLGTLPEKRVTSVAIVGTRRPTAYGREVTYMLAYELAKRGIIIISGMALGTDAIAHQAAINAGGTTIAVQANGLADLYPRTNAQLGQRIIETGGAIISEFEPNVPARDYQFLQRNRIVSGLADAVIVTEASSRSGTLNTAKHALEQDKEIFAVPGNITSPLSAGCNQLIRQGAIPITKVEDILEVISPQMLEDQTRLALGENPLQSKIIELLRNGMRDGDELHTASGAGASDFSTELTMMEMSGTIRSLGANQWTLR